MDAQAILTTITAVGYILWGTSELLALIPAIKANSIFQAVYNVIKGMAGR